MKLDAKNFRTLEIGLPGWDIREVNTCPMILIKACGETSYANDRGTKDHLVSKFEDGDLLLFVWVGQWKTDVFSLSKDDLEYCFNRKYPSGGKFDPDFWKKRKSA
ncbi:MAG: hypothetical protein V4493_01490 [Pseudomonadota bacterium]